MPFGTDDRVHDDELGGIGFKPTLWKDDFKDGSETAQFSQPATSCRLNHRDKE
jgi:hypothetical protein